jgi:exopolyphosphatase / guanosine-5'-triphosphate,3'-diphosphate pyrophosphatase
VTVAAAVDIGTNACRLLITDDRAVLDRRAVITRLGQDLAGSGRLSRAGAERTLAALREYGAILKDRRVTRARAVATAAGRAAADLDEFFVDAEQALGVSPEVITADLEARLTFRGAVASLPATEGPFLVVDVGGGSTELVFGGGEPDQIISLDLGSEHLSAAELPSDPPRPEELSNAISIVHDHIDEALRAMPGAAEARTIVGVGGTVTTIAAVELGQPAGGGPDDPTHHFFLTRDAAEDVFRTLAQEPLADRVHNPGLPPERAGIIVGGCCIVVGFLRRLPASGLLVSVHDLLDGIVAELA